MQHPLIAALPALPDTAPDRAAIQRLLAGAPKLVVLDDDPTGAQTVHGLDVLADWSEAALARELVDPRPAFYVLTNSRGRSRDDAIALNRQVAGQLLAASARTGQKFAIASRSDSTLRGHFPAETDVWAEVLPEIDATILIPAFFEGGRYTVNRVHYVADGERLVPAGETESARDATFGYRASDLTEWIEEKTGGRIRASEVVSIEIDFLRRQGAAAVARRLVELPKGSSVIVNAAAYGDLEIFTHGLLEAERRGKRYLFRTAASFVRVRAGLAAQPFLSPEAIGGPGRGRGLAIVGSYVGRTTQQLNAALTSPGTIGVEFSIDSLAVLTTRLAEIARAAAAAEAGLRAGANVIVYTSRRLESELGRAGEISVAQIVSAALVDMLQRIKERPRYLLAKGGITASDLAVKGLGMRRALVLGQATLGVPVWRIAEGPFPQLSYIIFPGNVGDANALRDLIAKLSGPPPTAA